LNRKRQIWALRFQYKRGGAEHSFETMPFYKKYLRGLLERCNGLICWIKGGIVRRPAYLVFYDELRNTVLRILKEPLEDGGFFTVKLVDPMEVVSEAIAENRVVIGYIKVGKLELGTPRRMTIDEVMELPYDPNDLTPGYLLNLKSPIRIGGYVIHFEEAYGKPWTRKNKRKDVMVTLINAKITHRERKEYLEEKETYSLWGKDIG